MSDENDGGIDRREAVAIGAAARYMGAQARQQAAHEAGEATRHHHQQQRGGSGLVTFLVVAVVLFGTLATMIALGR